MEALKNQLEEKLQPNSAEQPNADIQALFPNFEWSFFDPENQHVDGEAWARAVLHSNPEWNRVQQDAQHVRWKIENAGMLKPKTKRVELWRLNDLYAVLNTQNNEGWHLADLHNLLIHIRKTDWPSMMHQAQRTFLLGGAVEKRTRRGTQLLFPRLMTHGTSITCDFANGETPCATWSLPWVQAQ